MFHVLRFFVFSFVLALPIEAGVLFSAGETFKYFKGRTEASTPNTTTWRLDSFNDSTWASASAPFYYGEPFTSGTQVGDMRNNYSTLFFRKVFSIEDLNDLAAADLDIKCDDGFIAWVNGKEVARQYAPTTVAYNSFASRDSPEPVQFQTYRITSTGTIFTEGENVFAVQVFNVSPGSSDIVFDAQMFSIERETISPTIASIDPLPGLVTNLSEITVTFSEAVQGVDARDLLLNEISAISVSGAGTTYTFQFAQPMFGSVQGSWAFDSNIQDLAAPPNAFDTSGPNATFIYDLVDETSPAVATVHPPGNLTLKTLSQVEVWFNKVVTGVDASDLLMNGAPATNVLGLGAGPYLFQFPTRPNGSTQVSWAANHGIRDVQEKPLETPTWSYQVDNTLIRPAVMITEISAANMNGLKDQDDSAEDWIEIFNPGPVGVNLEGWSLTDDQEEPGRWVFPSLYLAPGQYAVVFASGKDRRIPAQGRLHTNFKLQLLGEYLALFSPDGPRQLVQEFSPQLPEQRNDYSYGLATGGQWRYFATPTPGQANGQSTIASVVEPVHFSVERGYFNASFELSLHSPTPGATIRYTIDGSEPTANSGLIYTNLVQIDRTRMVRAAAFKPDSLPSLTATHTYLFNLAAFLRHLPALSLVTASNNLYGSTGIMEPPNPTQHGIAWERPVSVELIRPEDNGGFQIDAGIRVHGGGYVRGQYNYRGSQLPFNQYSFRLYFRGDYGAGKLEYPFFPQIPLEEYDEIVLRAGMNDHTNPFVRDEFARALSSDLGIAASHGTFVHLFLNGVYKGLYNPTERIGRRFLQQWHGGGEDWDLIAQSSEIREGDATAWNELRNLVNSQNPALPGVYQEIGKRLDIQNFIDYLIGHIYADTDDWPYNNWRAARERTVNGRFRFYMWDAEWSFGFNNGPSHNTITAQLSNLSPPWGSSEIARLFTRLQLSPEFKLLFADRVHKHFFNGGPLTDERIRARYEGIRSQVAPSISGFNNTIGTSWIPQRRRYVTNHLAAAGFLASSNAPTFNQFGGHVPRNFPLRISALNGTIYYTTNGIDPRVQFSVNIHPSAITHSEPVSLNSSTVIKARTLHGATWSALTEASFQIERLGIPLRITEIMYNPPGGDTFEFIEIENAGGAPVDLANITLDGVTYRFREDVPPLAPGARIILASDLNPEAFAQRYPGVQVFDRFSGSLSNNEERVALIDPEGNIVTAVHYQDENGWPADADGGGRSLEMVDNSVHPNALSNWKASSDIGGSPGQPNSFGPESVVRLNEAMAENVTNLPHGPNFPDWVELHNSGDAPADLSNWSLSDDTDPRSFVFPPGSTLQAGAYLVVWCDSDTTTPGFHTGFALGRRGETVYLYDSSTNRVDALTFGLQLPDLSIGRVAPQNQWVLTTPTPGVPNEASPVALPSEVALNEIVANPLTGQPDWIELFNMNTEWPAAIGGMYLSASNAVGGLPELSFIPPGGYVQIFADENPGSDHLDFKLPASGAVVTLYDSVGAELSSLTYRTQAEGTSFGRIPNGTGAPVVFTQTISPAAENYLPVYIGATLSEVLPRSRSFYTAGSVTDWVEIHNPLDSPFDLSGFGLSLNRQNPGTWKFPANTTLSPGGFLLILCDPTRPSSTDSATGFRLDQSLPDENAGVYLINPSGQVVDWIDYGFQVPDSSVVRVNTEWTLAAEPTPGAANASPAPLGDTSSLRFNEWMAAPAAGDDWVELYNSSSSPVPLTGIYLTDDPSLTGRTNSRVTALSFVAPASFVVFQADGEVDRGADHLPFSLSALGETIRLYSSSQVLIDEINMLPQLSGISEGRIPDGGTSIVALGIATPGSSNVPPGADQDGDGMPDTWENLHGFDPLNPADAALDADGDGMINLQEFRAGTDPASAASALRFNAISIDGSSQVELSFQAAAGQSYTVFATDSLVDPVWERVGNVVAEPAARAATVLDEKSLAARFYRLVTPLQP